MFIRNAISKFKADFDEIDFLSSPPTLRSASDRSSSKTTSDDGSKIGTSSNAVLQNPVIRDELPTIPTESFEDEDDSNGQLKKRNLFQSLQQNPSGSQANASSLSVKSGTSSRAQSDSNKLNTKTENSISSNNSTVPSTYLQNLSMDKFLPFHIEQDDFAKSMMSTILRAKNSRKLNGAHHDTTNDLAQPVPVPKSPVDLPSVTPSSKTANGNVVSGTPQVKEVPESKLDSTSDSSEVVVYPKQHLSSTSVQHHDYDVPMIQPSVTQTSHDDSVTHNDDNLDDQQNTSETNNLPDSTPIIQPPPLTSKKLPEGDIAIVREISEDFASDKPSTSSNVQSPTPLNSTTTTPNVQNPPLNSITTTPSDVWIPPLNSTTTSPDVQSPPLNSTTTTSPDVQSPPLNSTTTSPDVQSPPLNSTTTTSPDVQSPPLNSITATSSDVQSPPLTITTTSPDVQNPPLNTTTTTSPDVQSPPLNTTTTDNNPPPISPKDKLDNNPFRKRRKPDMTSFLLNLATPTTQPFPSTSKKLPERDIAIVPSTSSNVQSPPLNSTTTDSNPISPKENSPVRKVEARRKPDMNSFLLNLVNPPVVSKEVPEKIQSPKTQPWRPPLRSLQRISESGDSLPSDDFTPAPDDNLARKMEDLGRLRRMESRKLLTQSKKSPETSSPQMTATPKEELRPQLQTLQEENSSDVATLLREAYKERQQMLQTQLDKALAELRDVQVENKRLTTENQSQARSISQLKIALDEAKQEQDNSIQLNNKLSAATTSLTILNKEKKGWQDKLDSMHHKLSAAERQVRCLDHLTRHKLESRQEAGYGHPKRRGQSSSIPASTDIIGAMRALNEEIYQTCVQLVEGLERTTRTVFSTGQKPQVQKVLGDHLTAMMEEQAKKTATSDSYNMLLMQTVLEVFMTHWCSSIIEAFYPQQESFADLLVGLSAQTTKTSGLTAICGKQIKIIQSSTHQDGVKFNPWVNDIIKDLGLFLTMAGLRMKTQSATLFSTKTLALVKVAYDLRTAMAEKDICGGLEIVIVPPDTPFQEKWMIDAHADPRKADTDQSRVDYVAGTTGIGLQRKVLETVCGQFQSRMEIELKPKVTLAQALKSSKRDRLDSDKWAPFSDWMNNG